MGTFRHGGCPAPEIEGKSIEQDGEPASLSLLRDVTERVFESGGARFEFAGVGWQ
jgi:hypothetical protein